MLGAFHATLWTAFWKARGKSRRSQWGYVIASLKNLEQLFGLSLGLWKSSP